jgi:hypothetical protein
LPINDEEAKAIADKVNALVQECFHSGTTITVDIIVRCTGLPDGKAKGILRELVKYKILVVTNEVYSANPKVTENLRKIEEKNAKKGKSND